MNRTEPATTAAPFAGAISAGALTPPARGAPAHTPHEAPRHRSADSSGPPRRDAHLDEPPSQILQPTIQQVARSRLRPAERARDVPTVVAGEVKAHGHAPVDRQRLHR